MSELLTVSFYLKQFSHELILCDYWLLKMQSSARKSQRRRQTSLSLPDAIGQGTGEEQIEILIS